MEVKLWNLSWDHMTWAATGVTITYDKASTKCILKAQENYINSSQMDRDYKVPIWMLHKKIKRIENSYINNLS